MSDKAPLSGHKMILDNKEFELVGAHHEVKGDWLYLLRFIKDVPAQTSLESNSHSEDFLAEPSEEQQT